jgi:hypothetical protein
MVTKDFIRTSQVDAMDHMTHLEEDCNPIIAAIQEENPHHVFTHLALLVTDKLGCQQQLHYDYSSDVMNEVGVADAKLKPFSVVIPLNVSRALNVVLPPATTCENVTVMPMQYLKFCGSLQHAGAANIHDEYAYSVHIYFAVCESQIPNNSVYK